MGNRQVKNNTPNDNKEPLIEEDPNLQLYRIILAFSDSGFGGNSFSKEEVEEARNYLKDYGTISDLKTFQLELTK